MEEHVRIATYDLKQGTAEEAADLAKNGMLPIFQAQPGFVRYGLAALDDGTFASISVWETHDEAEAANTVAADWVAANLADRIELKDRHVGDFFFDEGP
ncbi:MAG: antibiotic biosynthesis monooxygenase [Acidimicrobiia bacterium]